jgi:arsenate reductase (glutaredoxin)
MYGIRNCDTIEKARAWLETRGVPYTFHDYAVSGIDRARLEGWTREVGWELLCNRAGTTFRKLPETDKAQLTEAKALALMLASPSLIKRPVLVIAETSGHRTLVGFSPDRYAQALGVRL